MKIKQIAAGIGMALAMSGTLAHADITLRHALTGEALDLSFAKKGGDTEAFKEFLKTGKNPYNGNEKVVAEGKSLYMTGCSGCHGHEAEGKLGPG
ncbi:MAG: cytochrome c(L), periplasmic, partial [Methylicorpusculum sp.]|nr:cytochrome c(L), periplasmic [Methylicorpusculum sp.]